MEKHLTATESCQKNITANSVLRGNSQSLANPKSCRLEKLVRLGKLVFNRGVLKYRKPKIEKASRNYDFEPAF